MEKKDQVIHKKIICGAAPGCHCHCGLIVEEENGRLTGIKGNPDHPVSKGFLCGVRTSHFADWLYHPCQLKYPLKRIGQRGEDQWERISWDQALDEIADKLKQLKTDFSAECLAVVEGTGRSDLYSIRARLLNLWGNPANTTAAGTVCMCNDMAMKYALLGTQISIDGPKPVDGQQTEEIQCYVIEGRSTKHSYPLDWSKLKKWKRRIGDRGKIIAIDPRETEVTQLADFWLQIRPGTDTALLMSWIHVIIEEDLYDKNFVEQWTFGFDHLKSRAAEYPPESVADITWIPADIIRETARIYATSKPSCLWEGLATDHFGLNSIRAEQARNCLRAITGNLGLNGGQPVIWPGPIRNGVFGVRDSMVQLADKCSPAQRKKQLGSDRYKLMTWPAWEIINEHYERVYGIPFSMAAHNFGSPLPSLWRAILDEKPYPIKAAITWGANPLIYGGETQLVYNALKSQNLELHVVLDPIMSPTAMLADYVLPAASHLEKRASDSMEDFMDCFAYGERGVEPLGERRSEYDFFRELAIRLDLGEYFPWETEDEFGQYRLNPLGLSLEEAVDQVIITSENPPCYEDINPDTEEPFGFATPSGKIELYSNVLEKLGYDPLPFYEEPPESPIRTPEIAEEFPLILNTGGRFLPQFHSEHRHPGYGMREQHPDPLVEIHPDTARELDIHEGDWAYIETRRGRIKQKVKFNPGILAGVVNCEASWWFPEQPGEEPSLFGAFESNANMLTMSDLDACDQLTGGWPLRALLCKVYKVRDEET